MSDADDIDKQLKAMELELLSAAAEEQAAGNLPKELEPREPGTRRISDAFAMGDVVALKYEVDREFLGYLIGCFMHVMETGCPNHADELFAELWVIISKLTEKANKKDWF